MSTTDTKDVARRFEKILLCPWCMVELKIAFHEGTEVDTCLECNGIWVDLIEEKMLPYR